MRTVITGKIYRTPTAHLIVTLPSHFPEIDKQWNKSRLYRNQQGACFLAGEGGALSRWATITLHEAIAGEGLEPISKDKDLPMRNIPGFRQTGFHEPGFHERRDIGY